MAMTKKITQLTAEQEKFLPEFYQHWLSVGRSIEPISKMRAEQVITEMYAEMKEPSPIFLWFASPMSCILGMSMIQSLMKFEKPKVGKSRTPAEEAILDPTKLQLDSQLYSQLDSQLYSQLDSQLYSQLDSQLDSQLYSQLYSQLDSQLRSQLYSQLDSQLRSQLYSQLYSQLDSQLRSQLYSQLDSQLYSENLPWTSYWAGQQWCYWTAFYLFGEHIGVKYPEQARKLMNLWKQEAESCHWWWPFKGLVICSERPLALHVDDRGRLHHETEMAIRYADGWGIWSYQGMRVPMEVITSPSLLGAKRIQEEQNSEVRRIMVERFGMENFIREAGALVIDEETIFGKYPEFVNVGETKEFVGYAKGEQIIRLLETGLIRGDGKQVKVIHVKCPSTAREYMLRVNPDHRKAVAAAASTFQMTESEYRSMVAAHS